MALDAPRTPLPSRYTPPNIPSIATQKASTAPFWKKRHQKLSEKLCFSSLCCGFRIALQLLQEKIVYLSVSSKLDLRGLSFLVPSTMVFLNPKRTEIEFHSDYSLHLFYRQSGVYTTLDEKCRRWIVLSTAIVGTFLLAEVDTPLSR